MNINAPNVGLYKVLLIYTLWAYKTYKNICIKKNQMDTFTKVIIVIIIIMIIWWLISRP